MSFSTSKIYFSVSGYSSNTNCFGELITTLPFTSSIFTNGYNIVIGGSGKRIFNDLKYAYLRMLDNEYLIDPNIF